MITSLQHPLVKHFVKLRQSKEYRQQQGKVVIEGIKPIEELLEKTTQILYTSACRKYGQGVKNIQEVSEAVMQKVSGMSSPEGIIAEIPMPDFVALKECVQVLVLDGVSDPGNVGTLLRTALALGWEGVYFLPGGCDPFNEKVLRAARGAHFKLKLGRGDAEELKNMIQQQKFEPWMADIKGKDIQSISPGLRKLLVLGNEAHGVSSAVKNLCSPITIPMTAVVESLNVAVAGGILLYILGKGESCHV